MPGFDSSPSFLESKSSLPYPDFSKAHSKEDVRKGVKNSPLTPDPTDLTAREKPSRESHHAPPSPPLTGLDEEPRKSSVSEDKENEKPKKKASIRIRAEVNRSSSSLRSKRDDSTKSKTSKTPRAETPTKSKSSTDKEEKEPSTRVSGTKPKSKVEDEEKPPKRSSRSAMSASQSSLTVHEDAESLNGSDVTSIPPTQKKNSTTRKSTTPPTKPPSRAQNRSSTSHRPTASEDSIDYKKPSSKAFSTPPPPPPAPSLPATIPRVDYLLKNGGLEHKVSRVLLAGIGQNDPFAPGKPQSGSAASKIFDPYNRLLDDYSKVMSKNGSLAVATGYRSVARRLLDRLEAVFARDISSEPCSCQICVRAEPEDRPDGVSWGEVLELVSGRRELPMWPPFTMAPTTVDAGVVGDEHVPMQKLDIDVPEEYREHFIRQSRKTKVAVDKWLSEQKDPGTSAPNEVDDETLTFAMLTHLESQQRSLFCSLLGLTSSTPVPRSGDEKSRPKPAALVSSASAIQRLYRLPTLPRDPDTAMYMLNNPSLHHVLATLSAISDDEWEILISGRFDGFLRSGAEDAGPSARTGSRSSTSLGGGISRGSTPSYIDGSFRPSSQVNGGPASPASFGGPIALDEETEIAALAEVERDIFLGMEALEDAFEALHLKAEVVRRALRERGAGLSVANQSRRGSYVEARMGTPSVGGGGGAWEGCEDDFLDDDRSLAPDDSASNISSNRRRRPKRRTERRTPAPLEEEDEEDDRSPAPRGSRRR